MHSGARRASWSRLIGHHDGADIVESRRNGNLHPSATVCVHSKGCTSGRGRPTPFKPQLIDAPAWKGRETANREMSASIYCEKDTRAGPRPPSAGKDHDATGPARQCFDFRSWRGSGRALNEFSLKGHVPEQ